MQISKKHNCRCRTGFSLTEIVIVIIIIAILATAGIGVGNKQITKSRKNTTGNNLRIMASDIECAISDNGFLGSVSNSLKTNQYFELWEESYLKCHLDMTNMITIEAGSSYTTDDMEIMSFGTDYSGVVIDTINYKDAWDNECRIFYLIPKNSNIYRIIVASPGPNCSFAADSLNGYINGEYDDDILLIMEPRTLEGLTGQTYEAN
jgi:prepilin-type N-terminal cleavage/methylation domain-containing protein